MAYPYYGMDGQTITREEFAALTIADMRVAVTKSGSITVSTVLLGIDHGIGGKEPIIFETMIFGGDNDGEQQWRYATLQEAKAGHVAACALALGVKA